MTIFGKKTKNSCIYKFVHSYKSFSLLLSILIFTLIIYNIVKNIHFSFKEIFGKDNTALNRVVTPCCYHYTLSIPGKNNVHFFNI